MNYFELYGIAESFDVDQSAVKRKFYELSKLYHPDFYINEADEKQQEILELSTLNNKAYQVLSDKRKTTEYILKLHGLAGEGDKHQLPPEFLMDMMDVNEALMELEFDPDPVKLDEIKKELDGKMEALDHEFSSLSGRYASESGKDEILKKILDLWYRQKYLLRIKDSLSKFVA